MGRAASSHNIAYGPSRTRYYKASIYFTCQSKALFMKHHFTNKMLTKYNVLLTSVSGKEDFKETPCFSMILLEHDFRQIPQRLDTAL